MKSQIMSLLVMLISIVGAFYCIVEKEFVLCIFLFVIFFLSARIFSLDETK